MSDDKKIKIIKEFNLTRSNLIDFYRNIYTSRRVDEVEQRMKKNNQAFFQISCAGQEGIQTALASVLKPSYDYFLPYYRDKAICLGLGVTPYQMFCQANGNSDDIASLGRQMPANMGNAPLNIISRSSCTGMQFLHSCGIAEAGEIFSQVAQDGIGGSDKFHDDEVIYVSCGDGTVAQGEFWEGLTTSVIKKLPILFSVADNGYAISVPTKVHTPRGSISECLAGFPDLKIIEVDGNCPILSFAAAKEAVDYIRSQKGPVLLHSHVTRVFSHSISDDQKMYRTAAELENDLSNDVLINYERFLVEHKVLTQDELLKIKSTIKEDLEIELKKCLNVPWPLPESSTDHLYSTEFDIKSKDLISKPETKNEIEPLSMAQAINRCLKSEISLNPKMIVFGEDVADFTNVENYKESLPGKGGVFKVTHGVQKYAKPWQVFNSPLAEANIVGRACGMAMRGLKPVVEIQFFDYIWTAMMQIRNEVATTRYRSGGTFKSPMVIRTAIGGYVKGGAIYHSQCSENIFAHTPGLYIAFPSNAEDAVGLLRTAIRCDDPVLFLEHKHLYYQGYNRSLYPGDDFTIPFGHGKIVKEGSDATIVAWGSLVQKALDVANEYKQQGISIEVIDPRTIVPFDIEIVGESIKKTNRLLIAHESGVFAGFGGEIAAQVSQHYFEYLDAPIIRVGAKDCYVPYNPELEKDILPDVHKLKLSLDKLLKY